MKRTICFAAIILASWYPIHNDSVRADHPDDFFESKIRPILVETCFRCHSDAKASGELRINSRELLLTGGDSGPAIVPGKPDESLLIKAIQRQADVSAMPPEKDDALRSDQVADFVHWIKAGASWPANSAKFEFATHWSFEPIRNVAPPDVQDDDSIENFVDLFIRAKQRSAGVRQPSNHATQVADKLTLIRRATFDLTGLPPTPEEVRAFENDVSPQAFEQVIDRLLQSPHYGERWGRHWLDVVRYADTAGETADYPVPLAWRYRNYVINAFNNDKPYDEFLREQIAGDILAEIGRHENEDAAPVDGGCKDSAEHYAEQVTATGYLAISRRFGFDSENYHHLTIQDTIDNLGQSVLGLSIGCARCHDHKFDALSMHDYYGLYGIFDSSRYSFPGSEQKQKVRSMLPLLPPSESLPKWREFDARVALLAASLENQKQSVPAAILRSLHDFDGDFEMQAPAAGGSNGVLVPPWLYDGPIAVTNEAQSPFKNFYPRGKVGVSVPTGKQEYRIAQALYGSSSDSGNTLHVNLDFRVSTPEVGVKGIHRFWIGAMPSSPAVEVLIGSESVSLKCGDTVERLAELKPNQWHSLQLALDLKSKSVSGQVGMPMRTTEFAGKPFAPDWIGGIDLVVLDSFGPADSILPAIEFDNVGIQSSPIAAVSTKLSAPMKGRDDLNDFGGNLETETKTELPKAELPNAELPNAMLPNVESSKQELEKLLVDGPFAMTYGVAEGTPHDVRVQMRGEPDQLAEEVPRGFIKALGGDSLPRESTGSGRLELAQWLTQPDNPLTARVMINRIWQHHFGRGLVKTPNDFGVRGLPPTHPELLDYLATQFIQNGWSVKAMHRLIMLSATYQQSSINSTREHDDPDLYVSFRRRRLSAEEIRDAILFVSDELDVTAAQEHPFPAPTRWGYTQHSPFTAVYDHNKRSVYLMVQRLKRHPFLSLFDGADPNASTAERLGTTVPTQALFFLNDPFVHTLAEKWATHLQAANVNETQRIEQACLRAFGRLPTEIERNEAIEFLKQYRSELRLANVDDVESRSLAAYLRTLIGSNEFLHVD